MAHERPFKGKQLNILPDSFVCLDIETTGLSPDYDDIIEVSAIRVRDRENVATFSETINIERPLPPFITSLTGITDSDLKCSACAENVLNRFTDFLGEDIILGHNVNFDINFLYDKCLEKTGYILNNNYIDTLKISKKLLPWMKHHRLDDLVDYYGIKARTLHRALGDCELTVKCYFSMKKDIPNCEKFSTFKRM